jgi:hypothetical protein
MIYHKEFTLEKANYCSKMGIMLDHASDINVYNLGVSGATAQSDTNIPWVKQPAYDDYKNHYRCDVAIVQLGTNDAKEEYWDGGANYKKAYKDLLQNDIMKKCELVLLGLPPPTQCKSEDCRFGNPSSSGGLGDEDICCPDAWESPDIINVDLPEIVMEIAKELGLGTIPFREAIGECLRRNQNFTSLLDGISTQASTTTPSSSTSDPTRWPTRSTRMNSDTSRWPSRPSTSSTRP